MVPDRAGASTHAPARILPCAEQGQATPRIPGYVAVQGLPGVWKQRDRALLGEHSKRTEAPRRLSRLVERDEENVLRAVPEGSCALTTDFDWLEAIRQHPKLTWRRSDFRRNLLAVASLLLLGFDFNSHTVTPGNDYLLASAGIGQGTLGRIKRWLMRHGFLAIVAGGRSAIYTPKNCSGETNLFKAGEREERMADRAVYVLCRPATEEELARFGEEEVRRMESKCRLDPLLGMFGLAVDINGNPNLTKGKPAPKGIKAWASPTLKSYFEAATKWVADITAARTDLQWPLDGTTSAKDEATRDFNELQAARTVQWHSPPLRKLRSRHLARILAPFFRAGYTPSDILHTLDTKPDGTEHRHDGFHGALNLPALLQSRLNHWRVNGQPVYSRRQRALQRSQDAKAQARAEAQRIQQQAAERRPSPARGSWRTRFADDYQKGLQEAATRGTTH
ncbi:hypothetical protein [Paenarthrobacter ureafaciens]|uniref:hypothetical protein n=1 Tax=Paenarthrobacter ureafaciens TaxID=37931 RepID=UPI001FB45E03|nr:hypothetical protein [Paenarthrobacter ureafaciens]UOD83492.1 hypothetical protein MQZ73_20890 [Paenarthrobacter ureafaciens]